MIMKMLNYTHRTLAIAAFASAFENNSKTLALSFQIPLILRKAYMSSSFILGPVQAMDDRS